MAVDLQSQPCLDIAPLRRHVAAPSIVERSESIDAVTYLTADFFGQEFGERVWPQIVGCPLCDGYDRTDVEPRWLQPGECCSFTSAVHPDDRFEEPALGQLLRRTAHRPHRLCPGERAADLVLTRRMNVGQDDRDVVPLERFSGSRYDGTVERVAMRWHVSVSLWSATSVSDDAAIAR